MNDVFFISALRTPFGSLGGSLANVEAQQLAGVVIKAIVERTGIDRASVEEVIIGQVLTGGAGQAPARQAMRHGGLPDSVHAMTINKVCGSGLKAIMLGAGSIALRDADLVIAGGMESMSSAPYILKKARAGFRMGHGEILDMMVYDGLQDPGSGKHMGEIGDARAAYHGLARRAQDEYAMRSYRLAQKAITDGTFADEIVPVTTTARKVTTVVSQDEEPFKVDFDKLATLRPVFTENGTTTAGNASTINDGAALVLLAGEAAVKKYGLVPRARLAAYATHSTDPGLFPDAPVGAIIAVCGKAGVQLADIDLFEINEAFASVPMIAMKELNLDPARVNVNGGAVAIGHPIGASGARLAGTLVHELYRRHARYGLASLCIGGGEAVAMIIERV